MTENLKEKILKEISLETYISKYVKLKKKGKNLLGLCPFHNEKTPSFTVSSEKQFYHCFGCKSSGNVINFVIQYEKVEFKRALEILAEYAGFDLTKYFSSRENSNISISHNLNDKVREIYEKNLYSDLGKRPLEYLQKRELQIETIQTFQLGFALENESFTKKLPQKEEIDLAIELGLCFQSKNNIFDFFRNRIIFPIKDEVGKTIGFSGRIIEQNSTEGKYINSKASYLFDKKKVLYNLHRAKSSIKEIGNVYLVEGFLDVMGLYERGIENVVACMGTAISPYHLRMLKKYSDEITILLDGDVAGKKGAFLTAENCINEGIPVSVVLLKDGKDPFDISRNLNKAELLDLFRDSIPISEFVLETIQDQDLDQNIDPFENKKKTVSNLYQFLSKIDRETDKEIILKLGSEKLGISFSSLLKDFQSEKIGPSFQKKIQLNEKLIQTKIKENSSLIKLERTIVTQVVKYPILYEFSSEIQKLEFLDPISSLTWDYIYTSYLNDKIIDIRQFLSSEVLSTEIKNSLAEYFMEEDSNLENVDLIKTFKSSILQHKRKLKQLEHDSLEMVSGSEINLENVKKISLLKKELSDLDKKMKDILNSKGK